MRRRDFGKQAFAWLLLPGFLPSQQGWKTAAMEHITPEWPEGASGDIVGDVERMNAIVMGQVGHVLTADGKGGLVWAEPPT